MRRNKLYPLVALVAGTSALGGSARAQLRDTFWVKPTMMLLVDTSGSMERKPDVPNQAPDQAPSCSNNSATDEKNRWAITLEALTGTFDSYKCTKRDRSVYVGAYDQDYFLPHYEFTKVNPGFVIPVSQASDGVLDSYKTRLKFGLMTFDGVSTTVNGATLVPFTSYPSVKTQILNMPGQYSYPDAEAVPTKPTLGPRLPEGYGWKPLSFKDCPTVYGVNAGARGKGVSNTLPAGSLISVGPSESNAALETIANDIQTSLLNVRPYGGTPIAAMLDDLRYYLRNDDDIAKGKDPYYGCRKRYAVLLTDGAPDQLFRGGAISCEDTTKDAVCADLGNGLGRGCICPYDTEENLATKLREEKDLEALWVVAFNVNDAASLSSLDRIAQNGGKRDAYRATDLETLREQLSTVMDIAQPENTSRSVPVVINTGRAVMLQNGKQFQITAGFRVAQDASIPWEGRLWRQRIECNGVKPEPADLSEEKGDIFHLTLNARDGADRKLLTALPLVTNQRSTLLSVGAATNNITNKTNTVKPDGNTFGLLSEIEAPADLSQGFVQAGLAATPPNFNADMSSIYWAGGDATRDQLNGFLRGLDGTTRENHKLGDIYHSNPVAIPPIFPGSDLMNSYDPQLRGFYQSLIDTTKSGGDWGHYGTAGRPGVVYVATNDGILHAFNLDTWTAKDGTVYGPGYEFWGFVPPALFSMLPAVATPTHQFVFDGTPVVKDMILKKSTSGIATMKSILLVALRGLPAYVALDVTWPESPRFLWQRSFPNLGETVGTPALANVRIDWNGTEQIRAVAILPGGKGTTSGLKCNVNGAYARGKPTSGTARDEVRCWSLRGRWLYVVDVETGELIQEFDARHFHSSMTGSVAVDGEQLSVSRAAYMTDEDGVLWRLSMVSKNPSEWRVAPIWDIYGGTATTFAGNAVSATSPDWQMGRAATYAPLISRDPISGNLTIVVGTGDVDNISDTVAHRVVSLNEQRVITATNLGGKVTLNWALQLDAGESVTGPLVALNDTVYFTSFTGPGGTGDKCVIGKPRIVGGNLRKTAKNGLPLPGLMLADAGADPVLEYQPTGGDNGNSLMMGLSISRDPVCMTGSTVNDPSGNTPGRVAPGEVGGGSFTLRSMVGGNGGDVMKGSQVGGESGQRQFKATLPIPTVARSVGWASSIE